MSMARHANVPAWRELIMPIRRLLQESAFAPQHVEVLSQALDAALRELALIDRSDPAVELIPKRIIELACSGERDPIRLRRPSVSATIATPILREPPTQFYRAAPVFAAPPCPVVLGAD
jgi:hypothetical protein